MMMNKIKKEEKKGRRGRQKIRTFLKSAVFSLTVAAVLFGVGCQPNQTVLKDVAPPTPMETVESRKTTLEEDLSEMRTANFGFIYVFRRKDGGVFDKDDQKFLRDNTPVETNRWRRSDDGKAFVAGTVFAFNPEQLAALGSRFEIEDYSSPKAKEAANRAFNGTTNAPVNSANKNSNTAVKPPANK